MPRSGRGKINTRSAAGADGNDGTTEHQELKKRRRPRTLRGPPRTTSETRTLHVPGKLRHRRETFTLLKGPLGTPLNSVPSRGHFRMSLRVERDSLPDSDATFCRSSPLISKQAGPPTRISKIRKPHAGRVGSGTAARVR